MAIVRRNEKPASPTKPANSTKNKKKQSQQDPTKISGVKRSLPVSPIPLTELEINPPNNHYYEHRTVNSAADVTESNDHVLEEVPRKKKKRKIEPIDSEVEIFKSLESHELEHSKISLPPNTTRHLAFIRETMERKELTNHQHKLKKSKNKINKKASSSTEPTPPLSLTTTAKLKVKKSLKSPSSLNAEEKYPVLKNQELVQKFLRVSMTNNQKGRIRQVIRDILKGTSTTLLPEVINNRIQAILKSSENLNDTDLRKIRILYNMLKKATEEEKIVDGKVEGQKTIEEKIDEAKKDENSKVDKKEKPVKKEKKNKVKRYVVFVGNLPVNVTKDQILEHFCNLRECITDVRIPPREGKKSSIAYLELINEPTYQLALSQHHSMLGSKRINVLFTTQKNSKMSKADAKAKGAKLIAMGKNGQLIGSMALNKKRSQRRAKQRKAIKAADAEQNISLTLNKPRSMIQ